MIRTETHYLCLSLAFNCLLVFGNLVLNNVLLNFLILSFNLLIISGIWTLAFCDIWAWIGCFKFLLILCEVDRYFEAILGVFITSVQLLFKLFGY